MLTMLLGGLWHGANWTFVVWGGLHGLYLAVERWVRSRTGVAGDPAGAWNRLALALLTYVLVNITWVFFRSATFDGAARILAGMFGFAPDADPVLPTIYMIKVAAIVTRHPRRPVAGCETSRWKPWSRAHRGGSPASWPPRCCFAVIVAQGSGEAFIYFQF